MNGRPWEYMVNRSRQQRTSQIAVFPLGVYRGDPLCSDIGPICMKVTDVPRPFVER